MDMYVTMSSWLARNLVAYAVRHGLEELEIVSVGYREKRRRPARS